MHHGRILRQRVAGNEELLGPDVILVHRLLKNHVVASTGIEAYALLTQQCVDAMDVDVVALGLHPADEAYEHIGNVPAWIHDLERRWREEESRTRVMVGDEEVLDWRPYDYVTHRSTMPTPPGHEAGHGAWLDQGPSDVVFEMRGRIRSANVDAIRWVVSPSGFALRCHPVLGATGAPLTPSARRYHGALRDAPGER